MGSSSKTFSKKKKRKRRVTANTLVQATYEHNVIHLLSAKGEGDNSSVIIKCMYHIGPGKLHVLTGALYDTAVDNIVPLARL